MDDIDDFNSLLIAHEVQQEYALQQASAGQNPPKALLVETLDIVGLGNRIPSIVVGFIMALFTKRVFLLDSSVKEHITLPLGCNWQDHASFYTAMSRCNMKTHIGYDWSQLLNANLSWCAGAPNVSLISYDSIDYDMPFLQVNSGLEQYFAKFLPDGQVFHRVAQYLFSAPAPSVQQSLAPYISNASDCILGMQLRNKKYAAVRAEQFADIARAVVQHMPGSIFVASDSLDIYSFVKQNLPADRSVWWNDDTIQTLGTTSTRAGNPGTELSAIVDMLLLAKCKNIIVTPSSSLGAVAAGLAGIRPVFATFGDHATPFLNPWYWVSVTSEPCCFKLSKSYQMVSSMQETFRSKHPLFVYHNQCHH